MKILNFIDSVRSQRTKNLLDEIQTEIFFVSELPKEIPQEISRFLINFTETRIRKVNYLRQIRISKFLPVSRFESFETAFQAILKSPRKFILIISPGQWFESEFFFSLIPLLKNWKPGTLATGHLLDHSQRGQYYDLHPMSMVIAVKEFKEVFSSESLEKCWCSSANQKSPYTCFLRSKENHHDDYTPWWIEPIPQGVSPFLTRRFSRLLEHALKKGKRIESFSSKMRALKTYCYPHFTQSAIHHVIRNNPEGLSLENCYQKVKTLQILSHYLRDKNLKKEEIYWANNEPLFCDDFKLPFDRFVGLASGLKLFTQFALFPRSSAVQVLVLDENAEQLNWFKKILSFEKLQDCIEWAQRLKDDKQKEVNGFGKQKIIFLGKTPLNQPDTISLLGLQSEWELFRRCSFHFMNIDLLKEPRIPLEFIRGGKRCHVWFSNVFDYHWKMYEEGYPHLKQKFDEILSVLSGLENPCYLDLYRPAGGHIHMWSDEIYNFNGGIQTLSK